MKIVHVQVIPKLSGAQQISLDILSSLKDDSHDLYIISGKIDDFDSDYVRNFKKIGVKIIEIPSLKRDIGKHDFNAFCEFYRIFKEYNFDIIHTNSTKPAILARIAARLTHCAKIIHTVHGISFHKHVPFLKRIIYFAAEYISAFFGHKNISVNEYYKKFYPGIETSVIYNGVDFSNLYVKRELNKSQKINIAFFARLDEQKNPIEFIEAIYLLSKDGYLDNDSLQFYLAGDGELYDVCKNLIHIYNLADKIEVVGWVSNKSHFFNKIDVIVQPSKWEAFGLVFVEAAYFGIPSIATNVEGIPEVIQDEVTGLIYEAGAENLKKCIIRLINDPKLITELGYNAKKRAEQKFCKQTMVTSYRKIYFEDDGI